MTIALRFLPFVQRGKKMFTLFFFLPPLLSLSGPRCIHIRAARAGPGLEGGLLYGGYYRFTLLKISGAAWHKKENKKTLKGKS